MDTRKVNVQYQGSLIRTVLGVAMAGLLGACGASSTPTPTAGTPAPATSPASSAPGAATDVPGSTDIASQPVSLTFFHYSGSNQDIVPEAVIKAYTAAHPNVTVQVQQGNNTSTFPAIEASVKTTGVPTVNCGYFNVAATTQGEIDGIWDPIDPTVVTHVADFPAAALGPSGHGIEWAFSPVGLVYRTDLVTPAPTSWMDLLDSRFAGHVALIDFPLITYNGLVPVNRILGGTDADLSKGFAAYKTAAQAGQFQSIFTSTAQIQNLLQTGDVTLLGYAYGNIAPWITQGMQLGYVVPKEGQIAFPLYFQILKGSTPAQVYQCEQLINTLLDPTNLASYAGYTDVAPTSNAVQLPASLSSVAAYSKDAISGALQLDFNVLAQDTAANQQSWTEDVKNDLK